jgi:Arc/MetJ-type ribon-helix-helix transcriptional regulator
MARIHVSMPDGLKAWAEKCVADGCYKTVSHYMSDLVRRDRAHREESDRVHGAITEARVSVDTDEAADETLYLLQSPKNAEGLLEAVRRFAASEAKDVIFPST